MVINSLLCKIFLNYKVMGCLAEPKKHGDTIVSLLLTANLYTLDMILFEDFRSLYESL